MGEILLLILDYSEVWATLIPLIILLFRKEQPSNLKPVIVYVWLALFINILIDLIMGFKAYLPAWLQSNNPYYNVLSLVRFFCFSIFFIKLPGDSFISIRRVLPVISLAFLVINFGFFEKFFDSDRLSGNLLSAEAYLLLIYCLLFYLAELRKESVELFSGPYFWVVTGLSIYVVVNFFVFLFYLPMLNVNLNLSVDMWNVHNIAYIIFCIFIAKAFYVSPGHQYSI